MPRSIGIGVIAMGWMGMTHSRAYQQIVHRFPQSDLVPRLVICADSEPDRTDEAVQRLDLNGRPTTGELFWPTQT